VGAAAHAGAGEPRADLEPLGGRNGQHGLGQQGLGLAEHRFPNPAGTLRHTQAMTPPIESLAAFTWTISAVMRSADSAWGQRTSDKSTLARSMEATSISGASTSPPN